MSSGGHDTRKSHKTKARDRPIHSLRPGATDGPRKGGQGKGNWGRAGDEVKGAPVSRHDPNYDEDEEEVAEEEEEEIPLQPHPTEKKKFSEGAADLTKYKRAVKDAAEEFLVSGDLAVFVSIIKKETRTVFGQELPVILIRLALDKAAPLRTRLFALPKHVLDQGIINKLQISHSFHKLFNLMDELCVDAPGAEKYIMEALEQAVKDGNIERKDADSLVSARRLLADVQAVKAAKLRIKSIVDSYYNSGDSSDARLSISELKAPHLHYEVVKQVVQTALDRKDQQREMASVFIAELADLLTSEEIGKAFTILLTRVEDLYLDVPDILHLLSAFLARAVRDEALPPAFLLRVDLPAGDQSNLVVAQANKLLSARGASVRLGRIWGVILDASSDTESRSGGIGSTPNGDGVERSKKGHRNAMRRLRAKKRAAAAKGLDPSTITLGPAKPSNNSPKKEQKLKVAQIIPTKPSTPAVTPAKTEVKSTPPTSTTTPSPATNGKKDAPAKAAPAPAAAATPAPAKTTAAAPKGKANGKKGNNKK